MVELKFLGWQEDGQGGRFKLWNIYGSPRPELHPDGSTVSEESLKEMGIDPNELRSEAKGASNAF